MSSHFPFTRILILLVLLLGSWFEAPGPVSAFPQDGSVTSTSRRSSLPIELQDVIASTIYGATPQGVLHFPGAPQDAFGQSVALSGDGNTAIVGAPGTDLQGYQNIGVAYVFVRVDGSWQHQATLANYGLTELPAGEGANAALGGSTIAFGFSVSLSDDGNTALIGAPKSGGYVEQGAAFVFTRSGSTWTKRITLTADDAAAEDDFGHAVALSGNGTSALIGAPGAAIGANDNQGAAYLFTFAASTWTQAEKFFVPTGAANEQLGSSVSLDDIGLTAIVGAPNAMVGENQHQGMAYIFAKPESTWLRTRLTASDGVADDGFGGAVSMSGNGSTVAVGSFESLFGVGGNAAYVYRRQSEILWGDEKKLTATDSKRFGRSVALNNNGSTLLVGATWDTVEGHVRQGAAYIFGFDGSAWGAPTRLVAADGLAEDWLGISAALSDDGQIAFVATVGIDIGNNGGQGAVYAYVAPTWVWAQAQKITRGSSPTANLGWAVALSADGNTALVSAAHIDVEDVFNVGGAYIFVRSAGVWQFQARLSAADGNAFDNLGRSVALSGDGNTAILGSNWIDVGGNENQGGAYIFTRSGTTWTEKQKLTLATGMAQDDFGMDVALSGDGQMALIGAPGANGTAGDEQGAVYVATRAGDSWTLQPTRLVASDPQGSALFGHGLALSDDGSTALIGAYRANGDRGAAYVFTHTASNWTEQKKLDVPGGAAQRWLGNSVALSADGNLALVGAHGEDAGIGSAYVFARTGSTWEQQHRFTITGTAKNHAGLSVALSGDGRIAMLGGCNPDVANSEDQGWAYVFVRNGSTWASRDVLHAPDEAIGNAFGWSVAISRDGSTALVGAQGSVIDGVFQQGAAYPYTLNYPLNNNIYLPMIIR